jgi:hypothetical protein
MRARKLLLAAYMFNFAFLTMFNVDGAKVDVVLVVAQLEHELDMVPNSDVRMETMQENGSYKVSDQKITFRPKIGGNYKVKVSSKNATGDNHTLKNGDNHTVHYQISAHPNGDEETYNHSNHIKHDQTSDVKNFQANKDFHFVTHVEDEHAQTLQEETNYHDTLTFSFSPPEA